MRVPCVVLVAGGMVLAGCDPSVPDPNDGPGPEVGQIVRSGEAEGSRAGAEASPLVLFMGTSLTEGLGLARPDREAWPWRLQALADSAGTPIRVVNAGLSGETSAGARRRVDWVLRTEPDVFVLESGANDGLRGLPPYEMEANLDSVFARVRAEAPRAVLVLVAMEAPTNMGPDYRDEFRAVFPRVAERWGAHLAPFLLEGVAGVRGLNQADRIHPTEEGHLWMARTVWETLGPVVGSWGGR